MDFASAKLRQSREKWFIFLFHTTTETSHVELAQQMGNPVLPDVQLVLSFNNIPSQGLPRIMEIRDKVFWMTPLTAIVDLMALERSP